MASTNHPKRENNSAPIKENPSKLSIGKRLLWQIKEDIVTKPMEVILTIATILLAYYTYGLWDATKGLLLADAEKFAQSSRDVQASLSLTRQAIDVATRSNEISYKGVLKDRAYISFLDPIVSAYPPNNPTRIAITINAANIGNLPASKVIIKYDCPSFKTSDHINDPFRLAKWKAANASKVIGAKSPVSAQGCEIPIETWQKVIASNISLFYVVKVSYFDGVDANIPRIAQMSRVFQFDKEGGYSLGFTEKHNCAEDCQ